MKREDVLGAEFAEQQRHLVAHVGEDRRDQHDRDDADDDADAGEDRSRQVHADRPQGQTDDLAPQPHAATPAGRVWHAHSCRSASMGSMRAARRAGYQPATTPAPPAASRLQAAVVGAHGQLEAGETCGDGRGPPRPSPRRARRRARPSAPPRRPLRSSPRAAWPRPLGAGRSRGSAAPPTPAPCW